MGGKGGTSPVPGADLNAGDVTMLPRKLLPVEDLLLWCRFGDRRPALVARILVFLATLTLLDRRESLKDVGALGVVADSDPTYRSSRRIPVQPPEPVPKLRPSRLPKRLLAALTSPSQLDVG